MAARTPRPKQPQRLFRRLVVLVLCAVGAGCAGNSVTEFPPGLEPLEENSAPWPSIDGNPYPEVLRDVTGKRDGYHWVHARGYLHAPVTAVLTALRTPDAVVDRRQVAEWSVEQDVEPDAFDSFRIRNIVRQLATLEFDVTWRFGVVEGDPTVPLLAAARFQKTWGSDYITRLEGSVLLRQGPDGVTEVELIQRLEATGQDAETPRRYLRDLFASLRALASGQPLPAYD